MTKVKMPGLDVSVDPDEITKLEISSKKNPSVRVHVFLKGKEDPLVVRFDNKKQAITFYKIIWQQRFSDNEEFVEVGEFR